MVKKEGTRPKEKKGEIGGRGRRWGRSRDAVCVTGTKEIEIIIRTVGRWQHKKCCKGELLTKNVHALAD